ncbi:MAG: hypothetical protein JNK27_13340 [Chitinophagaceae bacterium]|nr:hypothetical protein [Chitinophagaceae bacterium]
MKRSVILFFTLIIFFSCKKEKSESIIGSWIEEANYSMDQSGQFTWQPAARFPLHITFTGNGQYYAFNDVPAGGGTYNYNPSTKDLRLMPSGSANSSLHKISLLAEEYIIIDYMYNSELMMRVKYKRAQ